MTDGAITAEDSRAAVDLLREADNVVLAAHVSPDGDALGSALALGLALRDRGVGVRVSYGDEPFVVPTRLAFLPGLDLLVPPSEVPAVPAVMVTFDTGSIDRLGRLAHSAKAAEALLVVDHHATNTRYGTHHLVDMSAAATALVVLELIDRLGIELTAASATAIYTGLTTDTGSFRFTATTPAVHEVAARLLRAGVRHDLVGREVFDTRGMGYLRLLGRALDRAVLETDAVGGLGLIWTVVPASDRTAYAVPMDEVEAVIGTLRMAAEAEVAVVLKELDGGGYAVSTRAKGQVDVARACAALGGGGHAYAAGFSTPDDAETALGRLRTVLADSRT